MGEWMRRLLVRKEGEVVTGQLRGTMVEGVRGEGEEGMGEVMGEVKGMEGEGLVEMEGVRGGGVGLGWVGEVVGVGEYG
ncbi:hypothetical protein, partial [Dermacoccus nishinomiyaensis]|uniref:hypothetical protein n=1 Tax=Dermacoccus nishinomiyaensis TaxID=1274 RepID=UPI0016433BF0